MVSTRNVPKDVSLRESMALVNAASGRRVGRKLVVFRNKPELPHRVLYRPRQHFQPVFVVTASNPDHARALFVRKRSCALHNHLEWSMLGRNQLQGWLELVNDCILNIAEELQRKVQVRDLGPRNL